MRLPVHTKSRSVVSFLTYRVACRYEYNSQVQEAHAYDSKTKNRDKATKKLSDLANGTSWAFSSDNH